MAFLDLAYKLLQKILFKIKTRFNIIEIEPASTAQKQFFCRLEIKNSGPEFLQVTVCTKFNNATGFAFFPDDDMAREMKNMWDAIQDKKLKIRIPPSSSKIFQMVVTPNSGVFCCEVKLWGYREGLLRLNFFRGGVKIDNILIKNILRSH